MKDGFIRVATATPQIRVADCAYNAGQVIACMQQAAEQEVRVLVLPEQCLTGYTCGDLFLQHRLLDGAQAALAQVAKASAGYHLLTVCGLPVMWGGKLYNCAAVVFGGRVLGFVPKTHLPNYSEFYEKRHFTPAPDENHSVAFQGEQVPFGKRLLFCCDTCPELRIAVELCEDLWATCPPSTAHVAAGATVVVNCSASDETVGKLDYRRSSVNGQSARLVCAYLYADAGEGESTTDMVFAGHNLICENGAVLAESKLFENQMVCTEIDVQRLEGERRRMNTFPPQEDEGYLRVPFSLPVKQTGLTRRIDPFPFIPANESAREDRCETILKIQAMGLKKRMEHSHAAAAVIGVSGGLDSTLAMLAAARAMDAMGRPRSDILAVTMPCFGTTHRTRSNAELLAQCLGATLRCVDITKSVMQHFEDIGHDAGRHDVVFENSQARARTQVLMDMANQAGGLVVGTGDLSELALGWATYNGDHMSMYGVNASVPKTLIRHIVRYEAGRTKDAQLSQVLLDILDTPVSPELLPAKDGEIAQKTEDLVGPYELHDFFLYYAVRWGFSPAKVYRLARCAFGGAYSSDVVLHWLKTFYRRFFNQQFKRSCLPDGPKVGSVTLSPRGDWRMPSDACAALWQEELEQIEA